RHAEEQSGRVGRIDYERKGGVVPFAVCKIPFGFVDGIEPAAGPTTWGCVLHAIAVTEEDLVSEEIMHAALFDCDRAGISVSERGDIIPQIAVRGRLQPGSVVLRTAEGHVSTWIIGDREELGVSDTGVQGKPA